MLIYITIQIDNHACCG